MNDYNPKKLENLLHNKFLGHSFEIKKDDETGCYNIYVDEKLVVMSWSSISNLGLPNKISLSLTNELYASAINAVNDFLLRRERK